MIAGVFEVPAALLAWLYGLIPNYAAAIALMSVIVMVIVTPLTLKSTKGMLEMQKLAPEMRRLQNEYRNDRQQLNQEMMKLYQEHKVNPMSSCLPLLAQMPVFIIMFRLVRGLAYRPTGAPAPLVHALHASAGEPQSELSFLPRYIPHDSEMFHSLVGQTEMTSLGLDLSKSAAGALSDSFATGLVYVLIVAVLGGLYFVQQRMVAARATMSPTMSPGQQKLMQYLPVAFAIFQVFFLLGLVVYYISQSILRIAQQAYITRTFYGHDEALGRQAQRAGEHARELAAKDGGGGGLLAQARRDLTAARADRETAKEPKGGATAPKRGAKTANDQAAAAPARSKRTTPPKGRPTPSGKGQAKGRPQRTTAGRPGGPRSRNGGKRKR